MKHALVTRITGWSGLAACLLMLSLSAAARAGDDGQPRLDLVLTFSLDGGKTWSGDFPIIEKPDRILVRATWANVRPAGEDDVYTTCLWSEQGDFGSANNGKQTDDGRAIWRQRPAPYWSGAKATQFEYALDLRGRSQGRIGDGNQRDPKTGKSSDGPLPACDALAAGNYKFTVSVGYWLNLATPRRHLVGLADFFVTVGRKAPAPGAGQPEAVTSERPPPLDLQRISLGKGDFEFQAAAGEITASGGGSFVAASQLEDGWAQARSGREFRWLAKDVPAGKYFIGVAMSAWDILGDFNPSLYVDGKAVALASMRSPGQVKFAGGVEWLAEAITDVPAELAPGGEVRLVAGDRSIRIGRLALYKSKPPRGPMDLRPLAQPAYDDKIRITGSIELSANRTDQAKAKFEVVNVLPQAAKATVKARVLDYFQQVQAQLEKQVTLDPRKPVQFDLSFAWGLSDRYRMVIDVLTADGSSASAVVDKFADAAGPCRGKLWLSGQDWEFAGLGEATTLVPLKAGDKLNWEKATIPGRSPNSVKNKEHCGWFRRTFTVPDWMPGQRKVLHFEQVNFEGEVVVNGKPMGKHTGWLAGFDVDVTDVLKPGSNELLVGVRDGIAALTEEEQAKGGAIDFNRKVVWPGITDRAAMDEVWLDSKPGAGAGDVAVQTSFRKKNITVQVSLENLPQGTLKLKNTVYFEGKAVLSLPEKEITASEKVVTVSKDWPDPILWGAGRPNLLRLDTEIIDAQGKRIDLRQTRFGFREFWAQDARIYLNGVATNFRAYAMNNDWGWTSRMQMSDIRKRVRDGLHYLGTMERHIYAAGTHYDVADEEGMPLACGVSGEAGATQFKIESDLLWRNTEALAAQRVRQLRNHPSIVEWYLSNEYSECASDPVLATRRLVSLRDACVAVDPTRMCVAGCDLDLRGALDNICTHYPVDCGGLRDPDAYLPYSALWHAPGGEFTKGMRVPAGQVKRVANVHGQSPFVWGVKPIIINETGWDYFYAPLFGYAVMMGDDAFRGATAVTEGHMLANQWFMAGHRDAQASIITPWHHSFSGAIIRTLPPLDIFPWTRTACWYAGTEVVWDVDVFHDTGRSEKLRLKWELIGANLSGTLPEVQYEPYGLSRQKVKFTAPAVQADTPALLQLSLIDQAGGALATKAFAVMVAAPRKAGMDASLRLGLIDPMGKTRAALERLGVKAAPITAVSRVELAKFDLVIVGEEAMSHEGLAKSGKELESFVENGGRLFCLHQSKFAEGAFAQLGKPIGGQVSSQAWARSPHHPVLAGMTAQDLQFWSPDHVVGRDGLPKPAGGDAVSLIDCGNATVGLDVSLLTEVRIGKGLAMFSQLMFADRPGQCPPANRLVLAVLDYLSKPPAAPKPCGLLAKPGGPLDVALKLLGANLEPCNLKVIGKYESIIADGQKLMSPEEIQAVRNYLQSGGRVLLHAPSGRQKPLLKELTGGEVSVVTPTPPHFTDRAILTFNDPLTDGLSNQDLLWCRQPDGDNTYATFTSKDFLVDPLLSFAYQGAGVRELSYPAGLAAIQVGKGTLYLDAVRWDCAAGEVQPKAKRIAAMILRNLGVTFRPRRARAALTGLAYRTIDISKHLNRELADEVADDGKGGWTDQGPDSDLRMLPAGKGTFAGIPFEVASPKSCLVLSSKYSRPGAPKAVEGIKVGRKADAVYFLQSCAWTNRGIQGKYLIHFKDGQTAEISLEGNVNLRDWAATNPNEPFPFETNTFTQVGWTGKGKHFAKVSVYVMEWQNPRPDVEVESFDFTSADNGIPVLLAVTSGTKAPGGEERFVKGDAQAAKAIDDRAKAAADKGDKVQAEKLSREALAKDPTYVPARVRLADLLEQSGKTEQALAELHKVIRIDPQHLETYLRIGGIYERDKQWSKALEIYQRSLQANPNQPPVMQAVARVKKAMAQ